MSLVNIFIVTRLTTDGVWIGKWILFIPPQLVTTLHSSPFQTSVHNHVLTVVTWQWLTKVDVPFPLGSRTVPGLSYQLFIATEPQRLLSSGDGGVSYLSSQRHYRRLILLLILLHVSVVRPSSGKIY
jgi:hypothetical protein